MPFKKGQSKHPNSGRKPGVANKKKILKANEVLSNKDINPTEEILKLIPDLNARDQVETWKFLLSFLEAKPKSVEFIEQTETPIEEEISILNIVKE